jgi:hypothetical protein
MAVVLNLNRRWLPFVPRCFRVQRGNNMGTISGVADFLPLFSVVLSASKLFKLRYLWDWGG